MTLRGNERAYVHLMPFGYYYGCVHRSRVLAKVARFNHGLGHKWDSQAKPTYGLEGGTLGLPLHRAQS